MFNWDKGSVLILMDTARKGKLPKSGVSYPSPTELNLDSGTSWRACGENKGTPA
jgi:hypothetical protein